MPHRESFQDIQGGRPIVFGAVRGHLLNDATQSWVQGVSKTIETDFAAITRADGGMEPYVDGRSIKIKITSWQDTYPAIKRAILWCRAMHTVVVEYGVDYYNFVAPYDLGMELTIEASGGTDIALIFEFSGKCTKAEWALVRAATAAAITGSTGGLSISGLTAETWTNAEYGAPGFEGVYYGTGVIATDDELGLKEQAGTKMSIKIAKTGETLRLQPITQRVEIKNTFAIFENMSGDFSRIEAIENTEQVITIVLSQGTTFVFDDCTKFASSAKFNDTTGLMEIANDGSTWLDPVNDPQVNVVFNDGTSTITFNKQGAIGA
jgi:hypothetical protein